MRSGLMAALMAGAALLSQGEEGAVSREQVLPAAMTAAEKPLPGRNRLAVIFRRLEAAYLAGDALDAARLLSPSVSSRNKDNIMRRLKREFDSTNYTEFELDDSQLTVLEGPLNTAGGGEVYQVLVPCRYSRISRNPGIGSTAGTHDYAYRFWVEWKDEKWGVVGSDLFATSGMSNLALHLGKLVFLGFMGGLIVAFWMWMSYHQLKRTRSLWKGFQLFLTTPIGAVVYFFRTYLQEPPETEPGTPTGS